MSLSCRHGNGTLRRRLRQRHQWDERKQTEVDKHGHTCPNTYLYYRDTNFRSCWQTLMDSRLSTTYFLYPCPGRKSVYPHSSQQNPEQLRQVKNRRIEYNFKWHCYALWVYCCLHNFNWEPLFWEYVSKVFLSRVTIPFNLTQVLVFLSIYWIGFNIP